MSTRVTKVEFWSTDQIYDHIIAIGRYCGRFSFPDYTSDLNAMHKAEMFLKENDPELFLCYVNRLYGRFGVCAEAKDRAAQFVLTITKLIPEEYRK